MYLQIINLSYIGTCAYTYVIEFVSFSICERTMLEFNFDFICVKFRKFLQKNKKSTLSIFLVRIIFYSDYNSCLISSQVPSIVAEVLIGEISNNILVHSVIAC